MKEWNDVKKEFYSDEQLKELREEAYQELKNYKINWEKLAEEIHANAVEKGFWDTPNLTQKENLIKCEVAEFYEALREPELDGLCDKCNGEGFHYEIKDFQVVSHTECKKCEGSGVALCGSRAAEELADIVIRSLDFLYSKRVEIRDFEGLFSGTVYYGICRPEGHPGIDYIVDNLFMCYSECYFVNTAQNVACCIAASKMLNIDLEAAIKTKMAYNATRPRLHSKEF